MACHVTEFDGICLVIALVLNRYVVESTDGDRECKVHDFQSHRTVSDVAMTELCWPQIVADNILYVFLCNDVARFYCPSVVLLVCAMQIKQCSEV